VNEKVTVTVYVERPVASVPVAIVCKPVERLNGPAQVPVPPTTEALVQVTITVLADTALGQLVKDALVA